MEYEGYLAELQKARTKEVESKYTNDEIKAALDDAHISARDSLTKPDSILAHATLAMAMMQYNAMVDWNWRPSILLKGNINGNL